MIMKAVILAGGLGTRLSNMVRDVPKPMAPIAGKPFLEYLLLYLKNWSIHEIILSIGYKGSAIKSYFREGEQWGIKITYSEEINPLGTGGAIRKALSLLNDEYFLIMNGDSFFNINLNKLILFHRNQNALVTMGLVQVEDTSRFGKVEIADNGKITDFTEKKPGSKGLINGGVYVVSDMIAQSIPTGVISFENDILPKLVNSGLYGIISEGFFVDIGIPQDYVNLKNNPTELIKQLY